MRQRLFLSRSLGACSFLLLGSASRVLLSLRCHRADVNFSILSDVVDSVLTRRHWNLHEYISFMNSTVPDIEEFEVTLVSVLNSSWLFKSKYHLYQEHYGYLSLITSTVAVHSTEKIFINIHEGWEMKWECVSLLATSIQSKIKNSRQAGQETEDYFQRY